MLAKHVDSASTPPDLGATEKRYALAWPLVWIYMGLVVYASLYPFADLRDQGLSPFKYLTAPLPPYWTWFDVSTNLAGYAPLGFLWALASLRTQRAPWAMVTATLIGALLSLLMETLQNYLPARVPSNLDWALNAAGTWLGACGAWGFAKSGGINRWSQFRARWFAPQSRGALVLLALWPIALLFPASVPLGLGQVFERLESALGDALMNTPFLDWLPVREIELQPLVPLAQVVCVALGALIPCLLGYCIIQTKLQKLVFSVCVIGAGLLLSALSAALSYGPAHAWTWLDLPVQVGFGLAGSLVFLLLWLPRSAAAATALLALALQLSLLNQAPASAYFAQTLQSWEQGRFIRFYGVVQWLGWCWPYAALMYLLRRLSTKDASGASPPP